MAVTFITQAQRDSLIELYVGYFNRAPEATGLNYWANEFLTGLNSGKTEAATLTGIADQFYSAGIQYNIFSAAQPVEAFITAAYSNVLGRSTVDAAGMAYWKDLLTPDAVTGVVDLSRGQFVQRLIAEAKAVAAADPAYTWVGTYLTNRVAVGNYFADNSANLTGAAAIAAGSAIMGVVTPATAQAGQTAAAAVTAAQSSGTVTSGQAFTLTPSVDSGAAFTGGAGNDTFTGLIDGATTSTLTALDVINGGDGTDTLNINALTAVEGLPAVTVSKVETLNIRAAKAFLADVSGFDGLTAANVTQAAGVFALTAATTTAVSVSGAADTITINGGKDIAVSDATAAKDIKIGETTVGAGAVTVTDTNQTTGNIAIDGGTAVTVTASKATTGTVKIGDTTAGSVTADMPTGAIALTTTGAAYTADDGAVVRGAITTVGGTTVTVNQTATSDSAAAATDTTTVGTVTQSAVKVTGSSVTTGVTVNQSAAVSAVDGVIAVAGVSDTQKVTFVAMAAAETTVVNGLTFTAAKALTAAEVAAAFSGLANGSTQGSAPATNGIYTGTFNTVAGSTGVVTTAAGASTVTFTSATQVDAVALTVNDTAVAGNVAVATVADGSAATTAVTGVMGVVGGLVTINGNITGADVLATVSLNGYGASSTIKSDALTSLSLANSKADLNVTNATATTLALALNNIGTASTLNLGGTYTTLNVTADVKNSDVTLTAGGVQTLTVTGTKSVDLTDATLTALKTVTVSGSAGLTIDASGANVTAVNTAATTGTVVATVDASKATYTGGAGVDTVTLSSTTVSKAVNTGAGDDTVTLATGTTALTADVSGGEGTDTLVMVGADAEAVSAAGVFETKIDGFEKLKISTVISGQTDTIDLSNMDDISYVISSGSTAVLAVQEVQSFTVTSGVTATKTNQVQTLDFNGVVINVGGTIKVGGIDVAVANGDTALTIAAKAAVAINGQTTVTGNTGANAVVASALGNILTITFDTRASGPAALTTSLNGVTLTSGALPTATVATAYAANAPSLTIGSEVVVLAAQDKTSAGVVVADSGDDTATEVAGKIVTALDLATVTYDAAGTSNAAGVVTVKYAASSDVSNITTVTAGGVVLGAVTETTKGVAAAVTGDLTLTKMANAGTLELTAAAATTTVTMTDATGTADSFNIVTKVNASDLSFGTVAVAGVETLNITATDTTPVDTTTGVATISKATLTVSDAAVKTIVVTGGSDLDLTAVGGSLTTVNASALTGKFVFSSAVTSAVVTGGSANDTLTGTGNSQTLSGGNGADTLIITGDLATLTGGAGNDVFNIGNPTTNVNSYATITDLTAGDVIQFASGAATFTSAKVTTGGTAVFQDLANLAIASTDTGNVSWFQLGGDTYVIENVSDNASAFVNNTDVIVKITGLVDLSTASFSASADTLLIA